MDTLVYRVTDSEMTVSESHNRKCVRLLGRVWIRLQMESSAPELTLTQGVCVLNYPA